MPFRAVGAFPAHSAKNPWQVLGTELKVPEKSLAGSVPACVTIPASVHAMDDGNSSAAPWRHPRRARCLDRTGTPSERLSTELMVTGGFGLTRGRNRHKGPPCDTSHTGTLVPAAVSRLLRRLLLDAVGGGTSRRTDAGRALPRWRCRGPAERSRPVDHAPRRRDRKES